MIAALRKAVSGAAPPPPKKSATRKRVPAWVVGLLVVAIVAGGTWYVALRPWPWPEVRGQRSELRTQTPEAKPPTSDLRPPTSDIRGSGLSAVAKASSIAGIESSQQGGHSSGMATVAKASGIAGNKNPKPEVPDNKKLAKTHFQHGCDLLEAKSYDEAIDEFKQAVPLDRDGRLGYATRPEFGRACLERGTRALVSQDFAAAVPDLELAAKLLPKEAKVFSRLGAAWSGQKEWQRAVECYTTAIEIEHHALDYEARGKAYRAVRALDKAIADFRQSVTLDPKNASAYNNLCNVYLVKHDPQSAIREIQQGPANLPG